MTAVWAGMTSPGACTAPIPNSPLCTTVKVKTYRFQTRLVSESTWIIMQGHLPFTVCLIVTCSSCTESRLSLQSRFILRSVCGALGPLSDCRRLSDDLRVTIISHRCDDNVMSNIFWLKFSHIQTLLEIHAITVVISYLLYFALLCLCTYFITNTGIISHLALCWSIHI